ncbi:MAG TPA: methyltransferase [Chitinophaga sp.]|uniref:tRNA1(Val) (adenine(37)-N6)-methyltransferase n=1 Tax=Chitinophaga sp. TaxID=1869181 RepID=UPI002BD01C20|nr:methyltransferase [Chitinophaga sp.]HVI43833.1 methyltransferase [Chitinophaga sp.]
MANSYFRFKQFTVNQGQCAMKVCTDACVQGAFTASFLADRNITATAILDIGAGTGLLSLMLAQQMDAHITAVELDPSAAGQARENFAASPWAHRLVLTEADVRQLPADRKYDFIISNPPFYEASLKSGHAQKDQAMHATTLGYKELIAAVDRQLKEDGMFSILLPYPFFGELTTLAAAAGYYPQEILYVKQSVKHGFFRAVGIFSKTFTEPHATELAIYDENNVYTPPFTRLLQPYYLYL